MAQIINKIEIRIIETKDSNIKFDFFIDGMELDKKIGIDRLSDMRFCNFDLDIFEVDNQRFPNYDRRKIISQAINIFKGIDKPINQFQTDRIVLYRCHCGCDYCGVISFKINFDDNYFYWTDIRFELDEENEEEDVKPIYKLQFDKKKYIDEFDCFLKKHCA